MSVNGGAASYYFYETNIFGDIAAVYNSSGSKTVSFTYDAWGNVTQTISNASVCTDDFLKASLFRYRGYIYDSETELYYLQSRYYDPEIGRFLNVDGYINASGGIIGYNMYAYCNNNPVMYVDPSGYMAEWLLFTNPYTAVLALAALVCVGIVLLIMVNNPPKLPSVYPNPIEIDTEPHIISDPIPQIDYNNLEQMPVSIPEAGSNVETFPVVNVDYNPVITSKNHNSAWAKERSEYWKRVGETANPNVNYGAFKSNDKNIERMKQGKAPIGWDGKSVQLHHLQGITNDFYDYSPLSKTLHDTLHKLFREWGKNKMNAIEKMLIGEMDIQEFLGLLESDMTLREEIRGLITDEMKNNPHHPIWKECSYEEIKINDFDIVSVLNSYPKTNDILGNNLNVFGIFKRIYGFIHPDLQFTTRYNDEYFLYLNAIGDSYEGEEVVKYIEKVVTDNIKTMPKSKRLRETKQQIKELFHVTDNKRPRWIQEAEWPGGKNSPMKYLYRKSIPDGAEYFFQDVDTNEIRSVIQYY